MFVAPPRCVEECECLRAKSYSVCYNLVMNPVAHLVWLRFLLHIPGRCQGPRRRQRSLPKSQPCYPDECVSCSVISPVFLCWVHTSTGFIWESAFDSLRVLPALSFYLTIKLKDECEISVFCMRPVPSVLYSPSRARWSQQWRLSSGGNYNGPTVDSAES